MEIERVDYTLLDRSGRTSRLCSRRAFGPGTISEVRGQVLLWPRDRLRSCVHTILRQPVVQCLGRSIDEGTVSVFHRSRRRGLIKRTLLCHVETEASAMDGIQTADEGEYREFVRVRVMTREKILAALQSWCERNYPKVPLPRFELRWMRCPGPVRTLKPS